MIVEIAAGLFIAIVGIHVLWIAGLAIACAFVGLGGVIENIGARGPIPQIDQRARDRHTLVFLILFGLGIVIVAISDLTHISLQ